MATRAWFPAADPGAGADITTFWDPENGRGDWALAGAALAKGDDLVTAIAISLFTDRLANPGDAIPDGSTDPRGWWGDLDQDTPIGSRLWLLDRSKATADVPLRAKTYIAEALAWLVSDGVAARVNVETAFQTLSDASGKALTALVTVTKPDGSRTAQRFGWVWGQIAAGT